MFEMFLATGHLPDSEVYENMNPFLKWWLFESWLAKHEQDLERDRMQAIFLGSFYNPEAAQKMIKRDHPDVKTTDDEQAAQALHEQIVREEEAKARGRRKRRRKRKVVR
jgi:hypothetical protein